MQLVVHALDSIKLRFP